MNINPFRLTAGAYLLSKDMRDKKRERGRERGRGGKNRRDFLFWKKEKTELLFGCHSHSQQKFPFGIMTSICSFFPPFLLVPAAHAKTIIINILLITLQICPTQDCFGKNKKQNGYQNRWKRRVHKSRWLYWVPLQNMFGLGSNIKELPKSQ